MPHRRGPELALLADPIRLRIVALVAARPRRPRDIALQIDRSEPTAVHHLRLLEEARIVCRRQSWIDGRGVFYAIEPVRRGQLIAWLAGTGFGFIDDP